MFLVPATHCNPSPPAIVLRSEDIETPTPHGLRYAPLWRRLAHGPKSTYQMLPTRRNPYPQPATGSTRLYELFPGPWGKWISDLYHQNREGYEAKEAYMPGDALGWEPPPCPPAPAITPRMECWAIAHQPGYLFFENVFLALIGNAPIWSPVIPATCQRSHVRGMR